jgi:hypothetical protein
MRRAQVILLVLGVLASVAATAWRPVVMPALTKVPTSLSEYSVLRGSTTTFVDERTRALLPEGVTSPMTVTVRVASSPGSDANRVVIKWVTTTRIEDTRTTYKAQYVLDRTTAMTVPGGSEGAWIGSTAHRVDNVGSYVLGPPIGAHESEYPLWVDQIGAAAPLRADGTTSRVHGVPVRGFVQSIPPTEVSAAWAAAMRLPTEQPFSAVVAQMQNAGFDLQSVLSGLPLSAAEKANLTRLMSIQMPLRYAVTIYARMLVEPSTGAMVEMQQRVQTLSVSVDLTAALQVLLPLLRAHEESPAARQLLPVLSNLTTTPPQPIVTAKLSTAPASVAEAAAKIGSYRRLLVLLRWLPVASGALGFVLSVNFVVRLVIVWQRRRRQPLRPPPPLRIPSPIRR